LARVVALNDRTFATSGDDKVDPAIGRVVTAALLNL